MGDHTLQVQGVAFDGYVRSANIGITIGAQPLKNSVLPVTPSTVDDLSQGSGTAKWLWWVLLLIVVWSGSWFFIAAKRRNEEDEEVE